MKENRILLDNTLGKYLKKLRDQKDYSQKEMSKILHLSSAMVGYIEEGKRMPTMSTLLEYSSHFSVKVEELIEQRIITIKNTVERYEEKTPHHIMNEYHLISYYTK